MQFGPGDVSGAFLPADVPLEEVESLTERGVPIWLVTRPCSPIILVKSSFDRGRKMIASMNCPACVAPLDVGDPSCPKCGALLSVAASGPVDRLANTAAEGVHDAVRAVPSVQEVGDEVAAAGRDSLRTAGSSGSRVKGGRTAATSLTSPDSYARTPGAATDRRSRRRITPSTRTSRARARANARDDRTRGSHPPIRSTERRAREDET